ncbi:MAG: hypothetical protein ACE5EN_01180 [Nitrospinota bacterium]
MNPVELFDIYEILAVVVGIECALLAMTAFASVLNAVRLDHEVRRLYTERVEMIELLYDDALRKQRAAAEEHEMPGAEIEEGA